VLGAEPTVVMVIARVVAALLCVGVEDNRVAERLLENERAIDHKKRVEIEEQQVVANKYRRLMVGREVKRGGGSGSGGGARHASSSKALGIQCSNGRSCRTRSEPTRRGRGGGRDDGFTVHASNSEINEVVDWLWRSNERDRRSTTRRGSGRKQTRCDRGGKEVARKTQRTIRELLMPTTN
jgi:hypothetical protein